MKQLPTFPSAFLLTKMYRRHNFYMGFENKNRRKKLGKIWFCQAPFYLLFCSSYFNITDFQGIFVPRHVNTRRQFVALRRPHPRFLWRNRKQPLWALRRGRTVFKSCGLKWSADARWRCSLLRCSLKDSLLCILCGLSISVQFEWEEISNSDRLSVLSFLHIFNQFISSHNLYRCCEYVLINIVWKSIYPRVVLKFAYKIFVSYSSYLWGVIRKNMGNPEGNNSNSNWVNSSSDHGKLRGRRKKSDPSLTYKIWRSKNSEVGSIGKTRNTML